MERKYRGLVAFDVDNTLLDHNSWRVPDSALRGIRELQKNDYLTVLATGRNMHDQHSESYLPIIGSDALVHMNGTMVELRDSAFPKNEWVPGMVLTDHRMDNALLRKILDYSEQNGHSIGACIGEKDYFTHTEAVVQHDIRYWGNSERDFEDPYTLLNLPVRALCYCGDQTGCAELQAEFPELHIFMFSDHTGADVFEQGYSKLDGLKVLAEHFGIDWKESFAFGDSFNDKLMLEGVNTGIAVGNAVPSIKDCADYVSAPISEDGIWKALKHFELI